MKWDENLSYFLWIMQLAGYSISSYDHFDLENYHTKIVIDT